MAQATPQQDNQHVADKLLRQQGVNPNDMDREEHQELHDETEQDLAE